jgi:hypothetical protein
LIIFFKSQMVAVIDDVTILVRRGAVQYPIEPTTSRYRMLSPAVVRLIRQRGKRFQIIGGSFDWSAVEDTLKLVGWDQSLRL